MAIKDKDKQKLVLGAVVDTTVLKQSLREVMSLVNRFVKQINKGLSKLGQIKPRGFTSIVQRRKDIDAEIEEKQLDLASTPYDDLETAEMLEEQIKNLEREKIRSKPVQSQKSVYKEGKNLITETSNIAYIHTKIRNELGEQEKVLIREKNIYKDIVDLATGVEKRITTTVRSQQEMTNAGLVWKDISNETTEQTVKLNQQTEEYRQRMNQVTKPAELLEEKLRRVKEILDQQGLSEDKVNSLTAQRLNLEKQIERIKDPTKKPDKTPLSVILKRFISVGTYRAIRNTLKDLATGITDAFGALSKISPEFNKDLSTITSSLTMLKGSIGMVAASFVGLLAPALQITSTVIGFVADGLSLVGAALTGNSQRMKINLDYWKDYQDTLNGTLLSFDTFTTLSQQSSMEGLFDTTELNWWESLLGTVTAIGSSVFVAWLMSGGVDKIKDGLKKVKEKLTGVGEKTKEVAEDTKKMADNTGKTSENAEKAEKGFKGFYNSITPAYIIITGITTALSGWSQVFDNSVTGAKKVLAVFTAILGTVAAIAGVLAAFLPAGGAKVMKAIGFGSAIAAGVTSIVGSVVPNAYAEGGNFRTGDFFVANENGNTELIASSNSGGGSVMNLDQWAQISEASFFNALSKYDAAQNGGSGGLDMDKLGTAIARSSGFRNEINRRNVGLNLV